MKIAKRIVSAVAFAGAALAAQGAMAADISQPVTALDLTGGSDYFGHAISYDNVANVFSDRYTFTLTGASSIFASAFSSSSTAFNGLDILDLSLFNSSGLVLKGSQLLTGQTDQWQLSSGTLSAGSYFLQVTGVALSQGAAGYSGGAAVTAVPEPATYGMMLGGLALVGAMAARRRKSKDAA